jgi:hypothetical protein
MSERISLDMVQNVVNSLSKYQFKGMLLEVACFNALVDIGVRPIPLHNPFDDDYKRDQHLSIDLLFRHNGLTYGVECKNINRRWEWSKEFVKKQLLDRFDYVNNVVPINVKCLVCSYPPRNVPLDFQILTLHSEVHLGNFESLTNSLSTMWTKLLDTINVEPNKPKLNSISLNNLYNTTNTIHGHRQLEGYIIHRNYRQRIKNDYRILKRADDRLRTKFEIKGWCEIE